MRNTFSAPADATAANGINLLNTVLAPGLMRFSLGTRLFSPTATLQLAPTAKKYDLTITEVDRGVLLFALALLMATLRD